MIRAILVAPAALLVQAEDFIAQALHTSEYAFGPQRWQDEQGNTYAVAAGQFSAGILAQAATFDALIDAFKPGETPVAQTARIVVALSNRPLEALQNMGLSPVEPPADPEDTGIT